TRNPAAPSSDHQETPAASTPRPAHPHPASHATHSARSVEHPEGSTRLAHSACHTHRARLARSRAPATSTAPPSPAPRESTSQLRAHTRPASASYSAAHCRARLLPATRCAPHEPRLAQRQELDAHDE